MAVVGVPGYIGSSAVAETGQRYMSAARSVLRLSAYGGYMTEMAGRSREVTITLGANHNYNPDELINWLRAQGGTPAVVIISGEMVAMNTGVPCLNFPGDLPNQYVKLVVNATLYGRGGDGGTSGSREGKGGGHCIYNGIGGRLQIENNAAICGGGGGGGGSAVGGNLASGGSGGRPFGAAGIGEGRDKQDGYAASLGSPGATPPASRYGSIGGGGGEVGQPGGSGNKAGDQAQGYPGGPAGAAVYGSSPSWLRTGTIYGSWI